MTEQLHFHFSLSRIREENGNLPQYSCLENPRDRGAWQEATYGVAQSRTRLKQLSSSSSMSIESVMHSNHLILCRLLLCLPSIVPNIRAYSDGSVLHIKWPKYWSFSFSISPSNEYSGLISFRMDWFDLLAVQGSLKTSLTPQFKSINSLALSCLYSPIPTSIHNYWKNHSFDQTDLC